MTYIKREDVKRKAYDLDNNFVIDLCDVNLIPSEDVAPVRHGHWIHVDYRKIICSVCGIDESNFIYGTEDWYGCGESKFCPNCGAKMDEE